MSVIDIALTEAERMQERSHHTISSADDGDVQTVVQGLGGDRPTSHNVPGRAFADVFGHLCILEGKDAIYIDCADLSSRQVWLVHDEDREVLGSGDSPLLAMIDALGDAAKRREQRAEVAERELSTVRKAWQTLARVFGEGY